MEAAKTEKRFHFLHDGGELGELTRNHNWADTPVGPIELWPLSLKMTVGTILHSGFPMFLWWGDEMIQFYNDAYRPSLGEDGKHPAALGQRAVECWPEIWDIIFPLIQGVRSTGKSFFLKDQLIPIYRNGQVEDVYWTFSYSAVIDEMEEIRGVLVTCTETTEQVQNLHALETSKKHLEIAQENLRNIIRQSPVAMGILKGNDFEIEIVNNNLLEIWGKQEHQVIGKPLFDSVPEVEGKGFDILLRNVLETGERFIAHELPVQLLKHDRLETKYLNFVYEPFREADGSVSGIMAVAFDVTDQYLARQKIEEVVIERTKSLRRKNDELSQFAYIASHDLQEPARKINTFTEMLSKMLGDTIDTRAKNYLNKIDLASSRMLWLIRDVLSLSQLSKSEQHFTSVNLNTIVSEILTDLELLIEEKRCDIRVESLPTINGSYVQLTQLFGNLISNALKFSSSDRDLQILIKYSLVDQAESLVSKPHYQFHKIDIRDNGIGFEQRNANQIFNIFQRLHGKADYEGTGIGLALCKKVVENHGGEIYATSSVGVGSIFTILFPATATVNS